MCQPAKLVSTPALDTRKHVYTPALDTRKHTREHNITSEIKGE